MAIRLNKYLADRGVGARRKCDELIAQGRVSVNGRVVSDAGRKVEEGRDRVSVDGRPVGGRARLVYYVLNKPVGVITTLDDPHGRRSVAGMLPRGARVYPVGRLDADTSGLLLLTNDGELAHKLMHPRYGVHKVYRVRLAAEPRADQLRRLAQGVRFDREAVSAPARVRRIDPGFDAIMIELIIHEGRFRQVRRMCEAVGLSVTGLHRVGYGPLRLGPLARGMFRELSDEEVAMLRAAASRTGGARSARPERAAGAPARPARTMAPEARVLENDRDDEEEEREVTYVPGGGVLEAGDAEEEGEAEEAPAWPARSGARRGDADWQREHPRERPGRPERPRDTPSRGRERRARPERGPGASSDGRGRRERPQRASGLRTTTDRQGHGFEQRRSRSDDRKAGRSASPGARFERGPRVVSERPERRFTPAGGRAEPRRPGPRSPRVDGPRFERRGRDGDGRRGPRADRPRGRPAPRRERPLREGRTTARGTPVRERFERGRSERGTRGRDRFGRDGSGRDAFRPARGSDRFERRPAGRMGERTPSRAGRGPARPGRDPRARPRGRDAARAPLARRERRRNPSRRRRG
jgi:23S rRNA pseudouridine2605 synthase